MQAMLNSKHKLALGFTTAMAAVMLSGCASGSAPRADVSASSAATEIARGRSDRAVEHAEAAVRAEPQNAAYRLVLGNTYLDAGRFASAETAFTDAMALGDTSPRAALALALSQIAQANYGPAVTLLNRYEGQIASADHGLALALAGQPERAIHIMSNAIRGGENTVKMRQNLAYAYAMAGRWREARLMAQQDVPAGEVGNRMQQWASMAPSDAYQARVAGLLGAPTGVNDGGMPAALALGHNPSVETLMAEAAPAVPALAPLQQGELAALDAPRYEPDAPVPAVARTEIPAADPSLPAYVQRVPSQASPRRSNEAFANAFDAAPLAALDARRIAGAPAADIAPPPASPRTVAPAPRTAAAPRAAAPQVASAAPSRAAPRAAPAAAPRRAAAAVASSAPAADGTHLVQLGSFLSEQGARRASDIYRDRYPELADREFVITEAVVRGQRYWRVSAGGYSQNASNSMCARVRTGGNGCMTWAEGRPLPGAVDSGIRLARR